MAGYIPSRYHQAIFQIFLFPNNAPKNFLDNYSVTTAKLNEIYELSVNGLMRANQCAIVLPDVCEHALSLSKKIQQQNILIAKLERLKPPKSYVPE